MRRTRPGSRRFSAVIGLLVACATSAAATPDRSTADAVGRGLAFVGRQQRADGSFAAGGPRAAVTGLGVLAYLSAGRTPDVGADGPAVRRAVDWLAAAVPNDGYVGRGDGSLMYGQAVVTLAVAEVAGVETEPAARRRDAAVLARLVRAIVDAQQGDGSWRVDRTRGEASAAAVGWTVLALRAAAETGAAVPADRVPRAVAYLVRCRRPADGAFADQPGGPASASATAMAVAALAVAGGDRAAVAAGAAYVAGHPVDDAARFAAVERWRATVAMRRATGGEWDRAWSETRQRLLAGQSAADGGWPPGRSPDEADREYATILAVLTLTVPDDVLPVGP